GPCVPVLRLATPGCAHRCMPDALGRSFQQLAGSFNRFATEARRHRGTGQFFQSPASFRYFLLCASVSLWLPFRSLFKRAAITFAAVAPAPVAPLIVGASGWETSPIAKTLGALVSWSP